MKKFLAAIICLSAFLGSFSCVTAEEAKTAEKNENKKIVLTIDEKKANVFGKTVENDVPPIIRNNRTMVASRFISENLGANVEWKGDTFEVEITKGGVKIVLKIGSDKVMVNGKEETIDSPAFIENDRIYTPARIICENLGADVAWEQETKKITITVKDEPIKDGEENKDNIEDKDTTEDKDKSEDKDAEEEKEEITEFTLGKYDQDKLTSNGSEPIEWIILTKDNNKALVISKYVLTARQYNANNKQRRWDQCTLRVWLNDTFFNNVFTEEEKEAIIKTKVEIKKNPKYEGYSGRYISEDNLFLLNVEEAAKYFEKNEDRIAKATPTAKSKGAYTNKEDSSWWWLRTFGSNLAKSCFVTLDGEINYNGRDNTMGEGGVRPAMWVDMDKVEKLTEKE